MIAVAGTVEEAVGREEGERDRKGKKGVEILNYPSSSHQNYCFAHGVVFVSENMCLLIISLLL